MAVIAFCRMVFQTATLTALRPVGRKEAGREEGPLRNSSALRARTLPHFPNRDEKLRPPVAPS